MERRNLSKEKNYGMMMVGQVSLFFDTELLSE